jgi:hypothetical protein
VDAKDFNQQYETVLAQPLLKVGFQAHEQSLFCVKGETVFALLRLSLKSSGFLRETHFVVCVRHAFLRTLEKEPARRFLTEPNECPFKFRVSELSREMGREWHYSPCNLGHWKYDTVRFGDLTDASALLADMRNQVTEYGMVWMERLTPAEALNQLKRHSEGAYCEKIWIEDYEVFLNQASVRSGLPIR